jgi:hypothetical protein
MRWLVILACLFATGHANAQTSNLFGGTLKGGQIHAASNQLAPTPTPTISTTPTLTPPPPATPTITPPVPPTLTPTPVVGLAGDWNATWTNQAGSCCAVPFPEPSGPTVNLCIHNTVYRVLQGAGRTITVLNKTTGETLGTGTLQNNGIIILAPITENGGTCPVDGSQITTTLQYTFFFAPPTGTGAVTWTRNGGACTTCVNLFDTVTLVHQ